jgi:glycogen operon protein
MTNFLETKTGKPLSSGRNHPIGATLCGDGVNFSIFSRHATKVWLLLFNKPDAGKPTDIIPLHCYGRFVWHVFVHAVKAGQLYGYKVEGEFNPANGHRFNSNKLLIDPYAKAVTHKAVNREGLLFGYDRRSTRLDLSLDSRDDSALVPKSIVIDDSFDWEDDIPPEIPFEKLIIYEAHLKGFTKHPSSGVKYPGTFLGFIEKIPYLKDLGVNVVELLPVQEFYVEDFLTGKGLTNYWGYNTICYFAPESSYSTGQYPGCQVNEFKMLVKALHKAGIEIILDVVYNHSGEGSELGPTLSFRGIDNKTYYLHYGDGEEPERRYTNITGCGNTINFGNPYVVRMVMDSLRYWVTTMKVDGFRFDLASVMGKEKGTFKPNAQFFNTILQDPVLCKTKLIAEPWDLQTNEVGNFPIEWSEWNSWFRDAMRRFGKGDGGLIREVAQRITGSADLFAVDGRHTCNSINFITCHDGFTLHDLVSYDHKHNEENMEDSRDGSNENHSWNCGEEGVTEDLEVNQLRLKIVKNHLCHLLLSTGAPMLLAGDEFLRTQKGNNNTYCHDSELNWIDWDFSREGTGLIGFVKKLIVLVKQYTVFQRLYISGEKALTVHNLPGVAWYGRNLNSPDWNNFEERLLCCEFKSRPENSRFFLILNGGWYSERITLPLNSHSGKWHTIIDTSLPQGEDFVEPGRNTPLVGCSYPANPRSTVLLIELR